MRLARGGTADVWRGVEARSSRPVAVKVVRAEVLTRPGLAEVLRGEGRLAARLHHPHIVHPLDLGLVGRHDVGLPFGAPWMAMELAARSAATAAPDLAPVVVRAVLSALAHAHAHGVLHRDVKPDNVLLFEDSGGAVVRLADFGIAAERDRGGDDPARAGTPGFMAPELRRGDPLRQGPWTDLYAVGCLAWSLLRRAVPPADAPPDLEGFDARLQGWLSALLQPAVGARLAHAADALALLDALPPAAWHVGSAPAAPSSSAAVLGSSAGTLVDFLRADEQATPAPPRVSRPVVAHPWRGAAPRCARSAPGPGVFAVRPAPLAGRDHELEGLRAALRSAWAGHGPVRVLLTGPAGLGKSRLARALLAEAAEQGVGAGFLARHSRLGGAGEGLIGMVCRGLGVGAAPDEVALRDLLADLGLAELDALVELLVPELPVRRNRTWALRHALIGRTLRALAGGRVTVVWLDDVPWSAEAIRFAATDLGPRSLVLLTASVEDLAARPHEAELLAALDTEVIQVGPLGGAGMAALIDGALDLEPSTRDLVVRRAGGHPVFTGALLHHWLATGGLSGRPASYTGRPSELPTSLDDLWRLRFESLEPEHARVLAQAAVLGAVVATEELEAAVGEAEGLDAVLADLVEMGLLRDVPGFTGRRFELAHGTLANAVLAALGPERVVALHRRAADVLCGPGVAAARRRTAHLLAAGDHWRAARQALSVLWQAMAIDMPGARAWMATLADDLAAAAGPDHPGTLLVRLLEAHASTQIDEVDRPLAVYGEVIDRAASPELDQVRAVASYFRAHLGLAVHADLADIEADVRRAMALNDDSMINAVRLDATLAEVRSRAGDLVATEAILRQALAVEHAPAFRFTLLNDLAAAFYQQRRYDAAAEVLAEARALEAHATGTTRHVTYQLLAFVDEARGDFAAAERWTRRSIELRSEMHLPSPAGCLNLADLVAGRGGADEAEALLVSAGEYAEGALGRLIRLAIAVAREDWREARAAVDLYLAGEAGDFPVVPRSLAYAIDVARAGDHPVASLVEAIAADLETGGH